MVDKMIVWCNKEDFIIASDIIPSTGVLKPLPSDTLEVRKNKKRKPYINKKRVIFVVKYLGMEYMIPIQKGYCWDGTTCLGLHHLPFLLDASMVHDILCEKHSLVANDMKLCNMIFREIGLSAGGWKWFMYGAYHVLNWFQKHFGRDEYGRRW